MRETDWWVKQLEAWEAEGTMQRLATAGKSGQRVTIQRSDGSTSTGIITAIASFGGRVINVKIDCEPPLYKMIDTDYFLEANPGFGESHLDLRPPEERIIFSPK
jgi:hypothetical protein